MRQHRFKVHSFTAPTDCQACGKLLVGLFNQGEQCMNCNVVTHKGLCAAQLAASSECGCAFVSSAEGTSSSPISLIDDGGFEGSSLLTHGFDKKTFAKPTDCAVCSKLLLGVVKQGVQCRHCGLVCHVKCAANVDETLDCNGFMGEEHLGPVLGVSPPPPPPPPPPTSPQQQFPRKAMLDINDSERTSDFAECQHASSSVENKGLFDGLLDVHAVSRKWDNFQATAGSKLSELGSNFKDVIEKVDADLDEWTDNAVNKVNVQLDAADKKINEAVSKVERVGVTNTVVHGIRAGTGALVRGVSNLAEVVENNTGQGEDVVVDNKTRDNIKIVQDGASKVRRTAGAVTEVIHDATNKTLTYVMKTDTVKEISAETDPKTRRAVADTLSGIGTIINETFSSVAEIGSAVGSSTARVSGHLYGPQVGKATQDSALAAGDVLASYMAVSGALTGGTLIRAPLRTAEGWACREPTVMNGCMYNSVFNSIELGLVVKTKLDRSKEEIEHAATTVQEAASLNLTEVEIAACDKLEHARRGVTEQLSKAEQSIRQGLAGTASLAISDNVTGTVA